MPRPSGGRTEKHKKLLSVCLKVTLVESRWRVRDKAAETHRLLSRAWAVVVWPLTDGDTPLPAGLLMRKMGVSTIWVGGYPTEEIRL